MTVGVLALQGAFIEHEQMLRRLGQQVVQVRLPQHLEQIDRLIIPGGESTTIGKLLVAYNLLEPIRARAAAGMPLWGTCAGMILLAREIVEGRPEGQPALGLMDVTVRRNAFGRQLDSFEADLQVQGLDGPPVRAVFIRAPVIERVGTGVEPLARLADGRMVAARQGHLLATAFHPELTDDPRFHALFLSL
ncbi:pyridoxal 5'-phosphate synthase glutaminase subunit PdxT [Kallotenue papyrolyticum]|uniref:pyridoxal 5'-phosphate synthase glutaminase subunit PdxT n=1 Tax=Kallotenue papyrolyticum TaxID=1325125 RepID=UPI00047862F9|nr:pyridoxal 5'-phosphate synthase glutaminase subunit PdxT [Kallotenue papyrolyticum]